MTPSTPVQPLSAEFYRRDVVEVARHLLGKRLLRETEQGIAQGRIVETEAYLAVGDRACHAHKGKTPKNAAMFGPAARAYVYAIHARHCLNVVAQQENEPSAVLIRAIEPLSGIALMQDRRGRDKLLDLARGPARLCEALEIDRRFDGWDITCGDQLWIAEDEEFTAAKFRLGVSSRIGVTSAEDLMLRFFVDGSAFVSGPKKYHSVKIVQP